MSNIAHTQEIVFTRYSWTVRRACRASECFVGWLQTVCGGNCGGAVREILPQAEVESVVLLTLIEMLPQQIFTGDQIPQLHARVKYSEEDARQLLYTADSQWNHESRAFLMLKSHAQSV